ncbi:TPA: ankyrin repeat domain-containing protein [Campylobacter coli]|nr:ankyrin repeat domain-containing protein [Campylobacter coli]HED6603827.1 ankyrin repeat domain-containing protein [Campylobacter coli]
MKTLEELKAIYETEEVEWELAKLVKKNKLEEVKEFLKDYPLPDIFLDRQFKNMRSEVELMPFIDPAFILGYAGLAYDGSKSFAMLEYFESLGLKAEEQYLWNNALTCYVDLGGKEKEIVDYFLQKGCTFEIHDKWSGNAPLRMMVLYNDKESVSALEMALKSGANPNIRTIRAVDESSLENEGETPLHAAAMSEESPIGACVEVLIKYGADVNVVCFNRYVDETGEITEFDPETPLDIAMTYQVEKNIKILKKAGAKTWKELVKEYNIDTSLEKIEQVKMYEERRKEREKENPQKN